MPATMPHLETLQAEILLQLECARECGLADKRGVNAFHAAMDLLDQHTEIKTDRIYNPLGADPLARDHVARLDVQMIGLTARVDILRAHLELALELDRGDASGLGDSLRALTRQLKTSFHREADLAPVYAAWLDRGGRPPSLHPPAVPMHTSS